MATVTVRSKTDVGFRRCNMKFTREETTLVECTDITSEQLAILREEPSLIVRDIVAVTPPAPPAGNNEDPVAKELIEKIKGITKIAELGNLLKDEKRVEVANAIKARIKELKPAK